MKVVLASTNNNKCKEIQEVASLFGIEVLSIKDAEEHLKLPPLPEIQETGSTYRENAYIKASICQQWCGLPSIGDDSGLEVEILDGAPGLYSARYAGIGASDNQKVQKLLTEVQNKEKEIGISNRNALFRAVLCLVPGDGLVPGNLEKEVYFEGTLKGEVIDSPRGNRGFGYDPIIHIHELGSTLAECDEKTVFTQGFRAKAAYELFGFIKKTAKIL